MVIDFGMLKAIMTELVAEPWDHALLLWKEDHLVQSGWLLALPKDHKTVLLDVIPTVENLAKLAFEILEPTLIVYGIQLTNVRLYETPNCWSDYSRTY